MEMERSLSGNKTMNKLTLSDGVGVTLPKQFCRQLLLGIRRNKSLSEVYLHFNPQSWYCPDGRLVYVSHILCDSVGCSVWCVTSNSKDVYVIVKPEPVPHTATCSQFLLCTAIVAVLSLFPASQRNTQVKQPCVCMRPLAGTSWGLMSAISRS